MEIIVGKTSGFCYGVKNAVDKSTELIEKNSNICCLGEIVHNKDVVNELKDKGMNFIEHLNDNKDKYDTIIRAHGVTKEVYSQANKLNIKLVDLTCPNVLKIHKLVDEHYNNGYFIFLIGTKTHPETVGTASFFENNGAIISEIEDIAIAVDKFKKTSMKKILIVVQTTFSLQKFEEICSEVREQLINYSVDNQNNFDVNSDLKIVNTICYTTKQRQEETMELSQKVECMIIIGGKNSSNTKKLYEIAEKNCKDAICIENINEINKESFYAYNKIGIMAGASTPQKIVNEIVEYLLK